MKTIKIIMLFMVISVAAYSFMNISKVKQAIQFVSITIFEKVRY